MILRNAVRSDERHRLGTPAGPAADAALAAEPPPLAAARVYQWLIEQGEEERRTCAAVLAPELEALRAEARSEGYSAGQATAMKEIAEQQAAALSILAAAGRAVAAANEEALGRLADSCALIVVEAFAKLGCQKLVGAAAVRAAVEAVLERARSAQHYAIFVHPADLDAIVERREDIQAALGGAPLELQSDETLRCGGCRVVSELEKLDASFERQLIELVDVLRAAHGSSGVDA